MFRKYNMRYEICKHVIYIVIDFMTVQIYYDSYLHQNMIFYNTSNTIFMYYY